ncbi:MAG: GNAT family N-acetyltransferase [Rhodospirillaceae bacterium]|nr:GNAT family N-acetyltransferase [Rhodospirillaceae bacterium]
MPSRRCRVTTNAWPSPESSSSRSTRAGTTGRAFPAERDRLDAFLQFTARKQQKDDFTRVFVAVSDGSPEILGYCAMNAHAVATSDLGADRPRRTPSTGGIPALYLSMIAVDRSRQGKGLGSDLAIDALGRARSVAGEIGLKLVVLDVIDDDGSAVFAHRRGLYRRLGFRSFQDRPERIFIAIDTIRAMFGDGEPLGPVMTDRGPFLDGRPCR